jgi:hypothetical protein
MHAWKPFVRALRFMEPWNARIGRDEEKPVQKFTTASAESVPPAPWVKNKVGDGVDGDGLGVYWWHSIGFFTRSWVTVRVV